MKTKLAVLFAAIVIVSASSSFACERCHHFGGTLGWTCWSGEPNGYQWCYGGGQEYCDAGGTCFESPSPPPIAKMCTQGVLGCSADYGQSRDDGPHGGFVLKRE